MIKVINNDLLIDDLTPKEHISLLKKVKSLSKDIDYKNFISGEQKLIDVLKPVLSSQNLLLIAKFLKSLPNQLRVKHPSGIFFCEWAMKEFHHNCTNVSFRQCIIQFESLKHYLSKCSCEEMKVFLENTIFAKKVAVNIDIGLRRELLSSLRNWCTSNNFCEQFNPIMNYIEENLELLNRLWDEEYEGYSIDLKNTIFLIEDYFRHKKPVQEGITILHNALPNSSFTNPDVLYLYKILEIKTPLVEIIQNMPSSDRNGDFKEELMRRFHTDVKDSSYPIISDKRKFKDEEEVILWFIDSFQKTFSGNLREEIFNDVNLSSAESSFKFFIKLLEISKTFDQLALILQFILKLPDTLPCNKNDIKIEVLKKSTQLSASSQFKYSFIKDLLKTCSVPEKVFADLLKSIPHEDPQEKIVTYWICLHSDSNNIKESAWKLIENLEDQILYDAIFDIPQEVAEILIPQLFKTSLCSKLVNILKRSEDKETLENWTAILENCGSEKYPDIGKELVKLKLFFAHKELYQSSNSLLSFQSLIQS